jgi:Fe2+ transport system protein B
MTPEEVTEAVIAGVKASKEGTHPGWKMLGGILSICSLIFLAGGGWHQLKQLGTQTEENKTELKTEFNSKLTQAVSDLKDDMSEDQQGLKDLVQEVKNMKEVQIQRGSAIDKIATLDKRVSDVSASNAERANNAQERMNTLFDLLKENAARLYEIEKQSGDRIKRTPLERWIIQFEKQNQELDVPELGH